MPKLPHQFAHHVSHREKLVEAARNRSDKIARNGYNRLTMGHLPETGTWTKDAMDKFLQPIWTKVEGSSITWGKVKGVARAKEKIDKNHGGDPTLLGDLWRATIFVKTEEILLEVYEDIKRQTEPRAFRSKNDARVARYSSKLRGVKGAPGGKTLGSSGFSQKMTHASLFCNHKDFKLDDSGYSGGNIVLILENGYLGEVQINTLNMQYAKHGGDEEFSRSMKNTHSVTGGLGHGFFEIIRKEPAHPLAEEAKVLSNEYYAHLRDLNPGDKRYGQDLEKKVQKFINKQELRTPFFTKHV